MNTFLSLPQRFDSYTHFALLLLAAIGLAEFCQRRFRLPRLTGYVLAGLLMGPGVLQWAPLPTSGQLRPLILLGLGLLLFELGSKVDLRWLAANRTLLLGSMAEAALTFGGVFGLLHFAGLSTAAAVTIAAIAVSTCPAIVTRIVAENNARGQLTQRLLLLTALNSLYSILLLAVAIAFIHTSQNKTLWQAICQPLYITGGSFLIAVLAAYTMEFIACTGFKREHERSMAALAALLLINGITDWFGFSVPMVLLCGGMIMRSRSPRLQLFPEHFGSAGAMPVLLLFVLTGLALMPTQMLTGGLLALGVVLVRGLAKYIGIRWSAGRGGLVPHKATWLGLALTPMASLAVLQAYDVSLLYPDFGKEIIAIILGSVGIMALLGPILTQLALQRVDEAGRQSETE